MLNKQITLCALLLFGQSTVCLAIEAYANLEGTPGGEMLDEEMHNVIAEYRKREGLLDVPHNEMKARRLSGASTLPNNTAVEADWAHDFAILKPIMTNRGFDTTGATKLCELPNIYCAGGWKDGEVKSVMGDSYIGFEYVLGLKLKDTTKPTPVEPELFELKRVGFFEVQTNAGAMPPGLERPPLVKGIILEGNSTHGLEGGLPSGFWSSKTRFFYLLNMGPQFTGELPADVPMCDTIDTQLRIWNVPLTGDVTGLNRCKKVKWAFLGGVAKLTGNVWEAILNWEASDFLTIFGGGFSGKLPHHDTSTVTSSDPWVKWCRGKDPTNYDPTKKQFTLAMMVLVQVAGSHFPAGFQECANYLWFFHIAATGFAGPFPLDVSGSTQGWSNNYRIWSNSFTGPLPCLPPAMTAARFSGNRFTGDVPDCWMTHPKLLTVDLSDNDMVSGLPRLPPNVTSYKLSGNRFSGMVPDSWSSQTKLEVLDLSGNQMAGPLFSWGWNNADPKKSDTALSLFYTSPSFHTVSKPSPQWPLKEIKLSGNPLGISVGFLLQQLAHYELESVHAANCGLIGWASDYDTIPKCREYTGLISITCADKVMFNSLNVLELSGNDITNLGWSDAVVGSDKCWGQSIADSGGLTNVKELLVADCKQLKALHPRFYATPKLDVRGASSLLSPQVAASEKGCNVGAKVDNCAGETWKTCYYLIGVYSKKENATSQCGRMGRYESSAILMDAAIFKPDVLCQCLAGHQGTGTTCSECPKDTWAITGSSMCSACPNSSTTAGPKSQEIDDCECNAGTFVEEPGKAIQRCRNCPADTYRETSGGRSVSDCKPCARGNYSFAGSTKCEDCPTGTEAAGGQGTGCTCAKGFYQGTYPNCNKCPGGKTTGGKGPNMVEDCGCPLGYFENDGGDCEPCGKGIACAGGTGSKSVPMSEAGFWAATRSHKRLLSDVQRMVVPEAFAGVTGKYSVFECFSNKKRCPEGPIGVCAAGREGIACAQCLPDMTPQDDGTCTPCKSGNKLVFVLLFIFGITVVFVGYYLVTHENRAKQPHSWLVVGICGSIMITFIQKMAVFSSMEIQWVHPIKAMIEAFRVVTFDIEVLQVGCVFNISILTNFALRLGVILGFLLVVTLIHFVWVLFKHGGRFKEHTSSLVCMMGTVFTVFLTSIVNAAIAPLQCIDHPNGLATVVLYPSIVCWEHSEHATMVVMGLVFLLLPLGFISLCVFACYQYPKRTSALDTPWLHKYSFLFFRYKADAYWYAIFFICRNACIAMTPVLPGAVAQTSTMLAILLSSEVATAMFFPWRVHKVNYLDLIVTAQTTLLLFISGFFVANADTSAIAYVCATLLTANLVLFVSAISVSLLIAFLQRKAKDFQYLICHHKLGGGAFARLLKTVLETRSLRSRNVRVFIDCDNLQNLEILFEQVGFQTETAIVLKSRELLNRPWCIGELVTVHLNQPSVKVLPIELPGFKTPDSAARPSYYDNVDISVLGPHGIDMEMCLSMMEWFLEIPSIMVPTTPRFNNGMAEELADMIQAKNPEKMVFSTNELMADAGGRRVSVDGKQSPGGRVAVIVDTMDTEVIATGLILCKFMGPHLLQDAAMVPFVVASDEDLPKSVSSCIMLWNNFALNSIDYISTVVQAAIKNVHHIQVFAEIAFRFPTRANMESNIAHIVSKLNFQQLGAGDDETMDAAAVLDVLTELFQEIATEFCPQDYSANEDVLRVKAMAVAGKLLTHGTGNKKESKRISSVLSKSKSQTADDSKPEESAPRKELLEAEI